MDSSALLVTFLSIIFLVFINIFYKQAKYLQIFNFIVLSESFVLTFVFAKFPFFMSFIISIITFFFIVQQEIKFGNTSQTSNDNIYHLNNFYSKIIASTIILSIIIYEYFSDQSFNSTNFLFFLIALILYTKEYVPLKYIREYNFLLLFLSLMAVIFFLPTILYKVVFGLIGDDLEISLFNQEYLIHHLLGVPLYSILSFLKFNVALDGQTISFEDTVNQRWQTVFIAESCAGITSIKVFIIALISYFWNNFRVINIQLFFLLLLGLFVSYFANLFRMVLIVLVGHYFGLDAMFFVHEYLGWIIFTFWVFLFWILMDKILINTGESNNENG